MQWMFPVDLVSPPTLKGSNALFQTELTLGVSSPQPVVENAFARKSCYNLQRNFP